MSYSYKVKLQGLDCAHCASKIEDRIKALPEVDDASIDLMTQKCSFNSADRNKTIDEIKKIVLEIEPDVLVVEEKIVEKEDNFALRQIIIGGGLFLAAWILKGLFPVAADIIVLAAYLTLGYKVIIRAIKNISKGQVFDENFLMALATIAAIALREYFEAGAVMLFYQTGELFQDRAVKSSRDNIVKLMDIRPDKARVIRDEEIIIDPSKVNIGEVIVVYAGEKIPLDGEVVEGFSSLDTSSLTGESLYREVGVNDAVISGCVNVSGKLKIKVTKDFNNSTVNKILDLVENTTGRKAKAEKFITKFAKVYTPIVVIAALIIAVSLPLFMDISYADSIKRAAILLIISCPCALVISIPLGFYAGIGGMSKKGILVKGSTVVESLSKVAKVVFDKTGTLTEGKFYVSEYTDDETLKLAAYAESFSNHPVAKSIVNAYHGNIDGSIVTDVTEKAGYGISCKINNDDISVGSFRLLDEYNIKFEQDINTVVYVVKNRELVGKIVLKDKIKDDAKKTVDSLKALGIKEIGLVSGDNQAVVKNVGDELGIDSVYGDCLPDQKLAVVKEMIDDEILAFVGDGINDAPVLSLADVGIAMGCLGSDAAIEASDVVIMDDMPEKISSAISLAVKTMNTVKANIVFALGVKFLVILLGIFGFTNMWLAIFADVGVSVLCILHSIRLLNVK